MVYGCQQHEASIGMNTTVAKKVESELEPNQAAVKQSKAQCIDLFQQSVAFEAFLFSLTTSRGNDGWVGQWMPCMHGDRKEKGTTMAKTLTTRPSDSDHAPTP